MKHLCGLTFCLLIILTASKLCADVFSGGNGTFEDPWLIQNAVQLDSLRYYLNNSNHYFKQIDNINLNIAPYNAGTGWVPIGNAQNSNFRGSYDGNGFSISGLFINRDNASNQGLFGYTYGARLLNIHLIDLSVTGSTSTGALIGNVNQGTSVINCHSSGTVNGYGSSVGGLLGSCYHVTVLNCSSAGFVNGSSGSSYSSLGGLLGGIYYGTVSGSSSSAAVYSAQFVTAGGLIGSASGTCEISECYATGSVSARSQAGGFIGYNYDGPSIQQCYATGNVEVTGAYEYACGGFAGTCQRGNDYGLASISMCFSTGNAMADKQVGGFIGRLVGGLVQKCYSTGNASGDDRIGGFCGSSLSTAAINDCFSSGQVQADQLSGGFIGSNDNPSTVSRCFNYGQVSFNGTYYVGGFAGLAAPADFISCYWDTQATGITTGTCGEGRTTAQMTFPYDPNTYVDFDFYSTWSQDTSYLYNSGYPYLSWRYLSPPANVWLLLSGDIVTANWTSVPSANSYKVYCSTDPGSADEDWLLLGSTSGLEYAVPTGQKLFIRIVASSVILP